MIHNYYMPKQDSSVSVFIPNAIRYPDEQKCLSTLLENPVMQELMRIFGERFSELMEIPDILNRSAPVTSLTSPRLWRLFCEAKRLAGVMGDIPLITVQEYDRKIETLGSDQDCIITISHSMVSAYSDEQLMAELGHALTHIRFQHVSMLNISKSIEKLLEMIPKVGSLSAVALRSLLLAWRQCAEYTADRGGAYIAGRARPMLEALTMEMGFSREHLGIRMCFPAIIPNTSDRLQDLDPIFGRTVLLQALEDMKVPFGAVRLRKLWEWLCSQECCNLKPCLYFDNSEFFGLDMEAEPEDLVRLLKLQKAEEPRRMAILHAAARKGNPEALNTLGYLYITGQKPLPMDMNAGLDYAIEAANQGMHASMFLLSATLWDGHPPALRQNRAMAAHLAYASAAQGNPGAAALIKQMNLRRTFWTEPRFTHVLKSFEKAGIRSNGTVNEENILAGIDPNAFQLSYMVKSLWIPVDETLYWMESTNGGTWIAALTNSAIYVKTNDTTPVRISLEDYCSPVHSSTLETRKGQIRMLYQGKPIMSVPEQDVPRSLLSILVSIRTVFCGGKR